LPMLVERVSIKDGVEEDDMGAAAVTHERGV
jgi:hypothetical protein